MNCGADEMIMTLPHKRNYGARPFLSGRRRRFAVIGARMARKMIFKHKIMGRQ
jgi:hypothetical protein